MTASEGGPEGPASAAPVPGAAQGAAVRRPWELYFAGPDTSLRLRDLLAQRVAATPAGAAIDFVSYYFRDRRLARDLVEAQRRGARVRVTLEGAPRTRGANDAVIGILRPALGRRLRVANPRIDRWPRGKFWNARLHEKLFCFTHPDASAFIGTFNPSGDEPELAPEVIREIGDQDRGYNTLVELRDPRIVRGLRRHARWLNRRHHGFLARIAPRMNRALRGADLEIHFAPGIRRSLGLRVLAELGRGDRLRLVASHLSGRLAEDLLLALARRGARVELLVDATARRVPRETESRLAAAGIAIQRVRRDGLPMHEKFALLERGPERRVLFGSGNWTRPSLLHNREIAALSPDPGLFDAFEGRWERLSEAVADAGAA